MDTAAARPKSVRVRLPDEREGITHRFRITDRDLKVTSGYIQVGLYEDGRPGEIFVSMGKPGDESSVWDMLAMTFSVALQNGVDFETLCAKLVGQRFEPSGSTSNTEIPWCTSIADYLARYLLLRYGRKEAA